MNALLRLTAVTLSGLAGSAIVIACTASGDDDALAPTAPDGATNDAPPIVADASTEADTPAVTCSASKICAVAVPIDARVNVTSIRGSSARDVWAVGTNRTVLHFDGATWDKTVIEEDGSPYTLRAVHCLRPDDVWILDGPSIRHTTAWGGPQGTEWSSFTFDEGLAFVPSGISAKDDDVLLTFLGNTFPGRPRRPLMQARGWAGGGLVGPEYVDASSIARAGLEAVVRTRADEAWATMAGMRASGVVRIFASAEAPTAGPISWQVEEHDSRSQRELHDVWGNNDAVWLVGEGGTLRRILRVDVPTKAFEIVPSPVHAALRSVFGFATDDIWAVGDDSTIVHWDGTTWTRLTTPFDDATDKPRLLSVWGSAKNDVWIGGNGVMLHFDGSAQ